MIQVKTIHWAVRRQDRKKHARYDNFHHGFDLLKRINGISSGSSRLESIAPSKW